MFDPMTLAAQVEPWWDNAGLAGAILGGGTGVLGAIYGTTLGVLAPRGRCRTAVFALHGAWMVLGFALLAGGLTALLAGQPYGVWYPLVLSGAISAMITLILTPVLRVVYRQAEHRRLQAEEFRRG